MRWNYGLRIIFLHDCIHLSARVDTDPCLGLTTPIAEQTLTTKTFEPSDTFCRLFALAFATGSFLDGERKPSLMVIDYLMCRYAKVRPLASHGTP